MSTRSIPAVSFRGSAGLPMARLNPWGFLGRSPSDFQVGDIIDDEIGTVYRVVGIGKTWVNAVGGTLDPETLQFRKTHKRADALDPQEIKIILRAGRPNLTDRALRYRANEDPPEGPEICCMCGSRRFVEIDHVDGFEENTEPGNLMWICRSCNTRKGIAMRNAGLGRRTHQYNPAGGARNLGQWIIAVMSAKGESNQMSVRDAVSMIRETSQRKRSEFAQEIWDRRRKHGTDKTGLPF